VADDIKKTRTAKIIDFTKRVLARRSANVANVDGSEHATPAVTERAAASAN